MIDYAEGSGKQYHIAVGPEDVGKYVILPGDPGRCGAIAAYLDSPVKVGENREFVTYTGYLEGEKVSVTSTGIGGPSASIAMEELAACGAHTFVRIGTCGGMQLPVKGGDVVIATGAIRAEGTTKEYAPIEFPAIPDFGLTKNVEQAAKNLGADYHMGVVQSKDAFYGQHRPETLPNGANLIRKWDAWVKLGAVASEMETASLFIVAAYKRLRCAACYLVMANQEREKAGLENPLVKDTDKAVRVAVEAMRLQIKEDK